MFLFYGYAWLFVSEDYVMAMLIGIIVALHHYLHYKQTRAIYHEKAVNSMVIDAVNTAWGDKGIQRLVTVAGQRLIDRAPEDLKQECAEMVKDSLERLKDCYKDESGK